MNKASYFKTLMISLFVISLLGNGWVYAQETNGTLVLNFTTLQTWDNLSTSGIRPSLAPNKTEFKPIRIKIVRIDGNLETYSKELNVTKPNELSFSLKPGKYKIYAQIAGHKSIVEYNNGSDGYEINPGSKIILPLYGNTLCKDVFADAPWRTQSNEIPILIMVKDADGLLCGDYDLGNIEIYKDSNCDESNNEQGDTLLKTETAWYGVRVYGTQNNNLYYPGDWYNITYLNISQHNLSGKICLHVVIRDIGGFWDFDGDTHSHLVVNITNKSLPAFENWYYGDTHYHSSYTDNEVEFGAPIEATIEVGKAIGLNWVTVTDHSFDLDSSKWDNLTYECDSFSGSEFKCLAGEEVSCYLRTSLITQYCHYLAYNISEYIKGGEWEDGTGTDYMCEEVVSMVNNQGGFGYVAHPMNDDHFRDPWQNYSLNFTGLEIWNGVIENEEAEQQLQDGLAKWEELLLEGRKVFIEGGTDAHGDLNYGTTASWASFPPLPGVDKNDNAFGKVRTSCYMSSLTNSGILNSLRNGHCFMTDGPALKFEINGKKLGETVNITKGTPTKLEIEWNSTEEFGYLKNISIIEGTIGVNTSRTVLNVSSYSDSYNYSLIPDQEMYIRLEGVTNTGRRVYTNPIWINAIGSEASITSPWNGTTFVQGESITFNASASIDNGTSMQVIWNSSIDGVIRTLTLSNLTSPFSFNDSFNISNLSLGLHNISVIVTDDNNVESVDRITINVITARSYEMLIVTDTSRLFRKYGNGSQRLIDRINEICSNENATLLDVSGRNDEIKVDRLITEYANRYDVKYLMIVGGEEIIPFFHLTDPVSCCTIWPIRLIVGKDPCCEGGWATSSNCTDILSDYPYADINDDWVVDLPIGRIVGHSTDDMITILDNANHTDNGINTLIVGISSEEYNLAQLREKFEDRGYSTTSQIGGTIDLLWISLQIQNRAIIHSATHSDWWYWGAEEWYWWSWFAVIKDIILWITDPAELINLMTDLPPLTGTHIRVLDVGATHPLVYSVGSHSGLIRSWMENWPFYRLSVPLSFLEEGAAGYIGSTGVSFMSQNQEIGRADILANYFYSYLFNGSSVGQSLLKAKQKYIENWELDSFSKKTLWETELYGDPRYKPSLPTHLDVSAEQGVEIKTNSTSGLLEDVLEISVNILNYTKNTLDGHDLFAIPGESSTLELYKPIVPKVTIVRILPITSEIKNITLVNYTQTVLPYTVDLLVNTVHNGTNVSLSLSDIDYNGSYPGQLYSYTAIENPDETKTLALRVYPFQVTSDGDMSFYNNFTFRVRYRQTGIILSMQGENESKMLHFSGKNIRIKYETSRIQILDKTPLSLTSENLNFEGELMDTVGDVVNATINITDTTVNGTSNITVNISGKILPMSLSPRRSISNVSISTQMNTWDMRSGYYTYTLNLRDNEGLIDTASTIFKVEIQPAISIGLSFLTVNDSITTNVTKGRVFNLTGIVENTGDSNATDVNVSIIHDGKVSLLSSEDIHLGTIERLLGKSATWTLNATGIGNCSIIIKVNSTNAGSSTKNFTFLITESEANTSTTTTSSSSTSTTTSTTSSTTTTTSSTTSTSTISNTTTTTTIYVTTSTTSTISESTTTSSTSSTTTSSTTTTTTISGECLKGDTDCNGTVSDFELLNYIDQWVSGAVSDFDLLEAIDNWAG
ncbi:MAG: CehA/McbA family metallohydrolase [Candidatus Altiarchaeales archaeon]|nr:CehA/McbA family metallohydrolase [Candidatus Altiarchaeota archaeon]MCG2782310.1 CehA/McbA family metallohydrolase [Candidatus Altiarchaeales archaeon]